MSSLYRHIPDLTQPQSAIYRVIPFLLIVVALWLPRAFALDRFVTIDENRWLTRSANFQRALVHGEYSHTFQQGHPGVTIMWLGSAGFLGRYPEYARSAPNEFDWENSEFEQYLRTQAYNALDLLAAGRTFAVLANVLALALAYLVAVRLLGWRVAFFGFLLIAADPFQIALTRFLHLDGLLSSWMLLALLAFLCYLYRGRRWRDLFGSAVAAGLAWLTKTPGFFLIPFVGFMVLVELAAHLRTSGGQWQGRLWARILWPPLIWGTIAVAVYVLLWPAMWVDPVGTVGKVLSLSSEYATEGHSNPIFFQGEIINGDPGLLFYPVTYLWRTTPVVLAGLILLAIAALISRNHLEQINLSESSDVTSFAMENATNPQHPEGSRQISQIEKNLRKSAQSADRRLWLILLNLILFALLFMFFMDIGSKKLDRYLVPSYPALDLAAATGWLAIAQWLRSRFKSLQQWTTPILGLALLVQLALVAPSYPYYMSYYNPLLGGATAAPAALMVGWGEGLDQAARYLMETTDETQTRVAAWYRTGPFDYFYPGSVVSSQYAWFADYAVTYVNQWQRQMPARQLMAYFDQQPPEKTFVINGIEYARVYNLRQLPLPNFVTDWGGVIRCVGYTLPTGDLVPGKDFDIVLQLVNQGAIAKNLNLLLRVVNAEGHELARYEWRPAGIATTEWKKGELWHHRTTVTIPPDAPLGLYRVEVAFFDPDTQERLPAQQVNSGKALGDTLLLDYLVVGHIPDHPTVPLEPVAEFGNQVRLLGADLRTAAGNLYGDDSPAFHAGDTVQVRLYWQGSAHIALDYTAFVHLVGPDGQLATPQDHPALNGFLPTTLWYPGQVFLDEFALQIPADAAPGSYTLHAGLYDPATVTRLGIVRGGEASGDAVVVGAVQVSE